MDSRQSMSRALIASRANFLKLYRRVIASFRLLYREYCELRNFALRKNEKMGNEKLRRESRRKEKAERRGGGIAWPTQHRVE